VERGKNGPRPSARQVLKKGGAEDFVGEKSSKKNRPGRGGHLKAQRTPKEGNGSERQRVGQEEETIGKKRGSRGPEKT